jgi:sRNA-binding carbon storage regulator CsrA
VSFSGQQATLYAHDAIDQFEAMSNVVQIGIEAITATTIQRSEHVEKIRIQQNS